MGTVKQDMLLGRAGGGRAGAAAKDEDSLGLRPSTMRESLVEFAGILSPYFWPKSRTNKVLALAWYVQARGGDGCPEGGAPARRSKLRLPQALHQGRVVAAVAKHSALCVAPSLTPSLPQHTPPRSASPPQLCRAGGVQGVQCGRTDIPWQSYG
jgi:hypothetical protein